MTEHHLAALAFFATWPTGAALVCGAVWLYMKAALS